MRCNGVVRESQTQSQIWLEAECDILIARAFHLLPIELVYFMNVFVYSRYGLSIVDEIWYNIEMFLYDRVRARRRNGGRQRCSARLDFRGGERATHCPCRRERRTRQRRSKVPRTALLLLDKAEPLSPGNLVRNARGRVGLGTSTPVIPLGERIKRPFMSH